MNRCTELAAETSRAKCRSAKTTTQELNIVLDFQLYQYEYVCIYAKLPHQCCAHTEHVWCNPPSVAGFCASGCNGSPVDLTAAGRLKLPVINSSFSTIRRPASQVAAAIASSLTMNRRVDKRSLIYATPSVGTTRLELTFASCPCSVSRQLRQRNPATAKPFFRLIAITWWTLGEFRVETINECKC